MPPDARLAREISLEVRAAAVSEVLSRVSAAVGVRAETDARLADQRVTISANNTSVRGLQTALARLFRTTWTVNGEGDTTRYRLQENAVLRTGATRLRSQRQALFLARLLQTEQALGSRTSESVAAALRSGVAARMPYLPRESLADITPDFIRQALLLAPLRLGLVATLARAGSASIPLRALSSRHQRLAVGFFLEQHPPDESIAGAAGGSLTSPTGGRTRGLGPLALNHPQARMEYRLVYGDRWTGMLLLTRVGAADTWAEATLPEVLYDVPDYMALYPETRTRPADPDVNRRVTLSLDTGGQTW
ncbi:MAG TPA: hypothetical protein VK689_14045, partial [Armatimonadota bacterium]|nr:hypothetical protein [Armatimonadota bacterium]